MLPLHRLFEYHVREDNPDSANHYLRLTMRQDRDNFEVQRLVDRFPTLIRAEPEEVEISELETVEIAPDSTALELSPGFFTIVEEPFVRESVQPLYPAEANGDSAKVERNYIKHWGELKGFSLALQTGKDNLGETATRLNRLIGYGPLLTNASQVIDIDKSGNYVRDQGSSWGEYMLHMAKVQKLMIDQFGVKVRKNDVTGDMKALAGKLGDKASAEND